jgi:hypothetical protein
MTIACPECGTLVELDAAASAVALCSRCRSVVRAPIADDASRRTTADAWKATSFALKVKLAILVLASVLVAVSFFERRPFRDDAAISCFGLFLGICYLACTIVCLSTPDLAARRSVVACVLTLILGSAGLFLSIALVRSTEPNPLGLRAQGLAWAVMSLWFGGFAVTYGGYLFLMRFHAEVARAFGNRRLRRHCFVTMFVPPAVIAANVALSGLEDGVAIGLPPDLEFVRRLAPLVRLVFNLCVAVWYALIVFRTIRTIDPGLVAEAASADQSERDDDDHLID